MTKIIETQVMIHRTTDFTRESSLQLHRTDVSQDAFTKELKARAQRELHQAVGVTNVDGDIRIKREKESDKKKLDRYPMKKKALPKAKEETGRAPGEEGSASTIDIRI